MKWDQILRIVGVAGSLIAYSIYALWNGGINPLIIILTAIIAIVTPDAIDKLPWGPAK